MAGLIRLRWNLQIDTAPPSFILNQVSAQDNAVVTNKNVIRPFCQWAYVFVVLAAE
jgi:hypothetical protein